MTIEAILLTGGASRRMGADKATLALGDTTLGHRIVEAIANEGIAITVLGREPIEGARFQPDSAEFAGPLAALAAYRPSADRIFVVSCDLPRFDPRMIRFLQSEAGDADGAVPLVGGRLQSLCAVYRASALGEARVAFDSGARSMMAWLDRLKIIHVHEDRISAAGLDPNSVLGVNTPQEFSDAISTLADT